jgi:L-lactate permease
MRRNHTLVTCAVAFLVVAPTNQLALIVYTAAALLLLIFLGVILPAIFLNDHNRRQDAIAVLTQILDTIRRPRSP